MIGMLWLRVWLRMAAGLLALVVMLLAVGPGPDLPFLRPTPGCRPPCFLGIQLGQTSVQEVFTALDRYPGLIYRAETEPFDSHNEWVRVNWTYDYGAGTVRGSIFLSNFIASRVTIYDLPFGAIWLALGSPSASQSITQVLTYDGGFPILVPSTHIAYYDAYRLRVDAPTHCGGFWETAAQVYIGEYQRRPEVYVNHVWEHRLQACSALRQQRVTRFRSGRFLTDAYRLIFG